MSSSTDRVGVSRVAEILALIADPPNRRQSPRGDDLTGNYAFWFDGGACSIFTGSDTHYFYTDGSEATVSVIWLPLSVRIELADGRVVDINQRETEEKHEKSQFHAWEYPIAQDSPRHRASYCVYCGWKQADSQNDNCCGRCGLVRHVSGGSDTMAQCLNCEEWSLAGGKYCEFCGAPRDV